METLLGLLIIAGLIVIIVGAILFFIDYAKKNSKKVSLIVLSGGLVLILIGIVGNIGIQNHQAKIAAQEKAEQVQLAKKKNAKFTTYATSFVSTFNDTWNDTVKLNNKTDKSWSSAIESDSESFDVNKTIEKVESDNSNLILGITTNQDQLNKDIKNLKANNTGKYDIKKYETANNKIQAYANFVVNPSGSYNEYGSKTTDLNSAVTTAADAFSE